MFMTLSNWKGEKPLGQVSRLAVLDTEPGQLDSVFSNASLGGIAYEKF